MSDYISREAAEIAMCDACEYDCKPHKRASGQSLITAEDCYHLRDLAAVPAADVIEVRHGRWVAESYYAGPIKMWGWKCTACGAFSHVDYKFCPSCMARMDESKDDGTA